MKLFSFFFTIWAFYKNNIFFIIYSSGLRPGILCFLFISTTGSYKRVHNLNAIRLLEMLLKCHQNSTLVYIVYINTIGVVMFLYSIWKIWPWQGDHLFSSYNWIGYVLSCPTFLSKSKAKISKYIQLQNVFLHQNRLNERSPLPIQ